MRAPRRPPTGDPDTLALYDSVEQWAESLPDPQRWLGAPRKVRDGETVAFGDHALVVATSAAEVNIPAATRADIGKCLAVTIYEGTANVTIRAGASLINGASSATLSSPSVGRVCTVVAEGEWLVA